MAYIPDLWVDRARPFWPALTLLLYSGLVVALVATNAPATIRAIPVLTYIAVVPGLACVRLMHLRDHLSELLLGVGLSLALGTVVALGMIYAGLWSPTLGIVTLGSVASIAAAIELFRRGPDSPAVRSTNRRSS